MQRGNSWTSRKTRQGKAKIKTLSIRKADPKCNWPIGGFFGGTSKRDATQAKWKQCTTSKLLAWTALSIIPPSARIRILFLFPRNEGVSMSFVLDLVQYDFYLGYAEGFKEKKVHVRCVHYMMTHILSPKLTPFLIHRHWCKRNLWTVKWNCPLKWLLKSFFNILNFF